MVDVNIEAKDGLPEGELGSIIVKENLAKPEDIELLREMVQTMLSRDKKQILINITRVNIISMEAIHAIEGLKQFAKIHGAMVAVIDDHPHMMLERVLLHRSSGFFRDVESALHYFQSTHNPNDSSSNA